MSSKQLKSVRPDSKGRILLGALAKGVSSYTITKDHGRLILEPNVEIPAQEKWLWENKQALQRVKKGLQDSADGKIKSRGNFKKFAEDKK
ncbi:MAG: hypothetical protein P4M12_06440 [Gammaproteobacteria bacterium]|nr:hypothetical protein [Gammaproteobacteria bacterium]